MSPTAAAMRMAWCLLAAATLAAALRVWWPIHLAARAAAGGEDARLRDWSAAQARALGGLVLVAAFNLAAGINAYLVPTRPDAHWPPRDRVDWWPITLPLWFVGSAVAKLVIVVTIWRSYQRVTAGRPAGGVHRA